MNKEIKINTDRVVSTIPTAHLDFIVHFGVSQFGISSCACGVINNRHLDLLQNVGKIGNVWERSFTPTCPGEKKIIIKIKITRKAASKPSS